MACGSTFRDHCELAERQYSQPAVFLGGPESTTIPIAIQPVTELRPGRRLGSGVGPVGG
jgi:hypothetical protein